MRRRPSARRQRREPRVQPAVRRQLGRASQRRLGGQKARHEHDHHDDEQQLRRTPNDRDGPFHGCGSSRSRIALADIFVR